MDLSWLGWRSVCLCLAVPFAIAIRAGIFQNAIPPDSMVDRIACAVPVSSPGKSQFDCTGRTECGFSMPSQPIV